MLEDTQDIFDIVLQHIGAGENREFYMCDQLYTLEAIGELDTEFGEDIRAEIAVFIAHKFSLHRYIMQRVFGDTTSDTHRTSRGLFYQKDTLDVRLRIYSDWENRQEILDEFVAAMRKVYGL